MAQEMNPFTRLGLPTPKFFKRNAWVMSTVGAVAIIVASVAPPLSVTFYVASVIGIFAGGSLSTGVMAVEDKNTAIDNAINKIKSKYDGKINNVRKNADVTSPSTIVAVDILQKEMEGKIKIAVEKLTNKYLRK